MHKAELDNNQDEKQKCSRTLNDIRKTLSDIDRDLRTKNADKSKAHEVMMNASRNQVRGLLNLQPFSFSFT
jgi:septal ring factor EnvC (AmiA/AmiB activator)